MKKLLVVGCFLVAAIALGQQIVNQGRPGNQGPWFVAGTVHVFMDGGQRVIADQGAPAAAPWACYVAMDGGQRVLVDQGTTPWTVAGTVTANQGTSPWVVSGVGDFNNASVSPTGAPPPASATYCGFTDGVNLQGARTFDTDTGAGVQNVLGSNIRISGPGGSTEAAAGAGVTTASTLRVVLPTDQTAISVTLPANQSVNLAQVGGTATVFGGLAGTLAVGGTQANNTAISANPMLVGFEALSTQPVAATTGNIRRGISSLDGAQYVRPGGPVTWTCSLDNIAGTLTQCQAAPGAGLRLYITDIVIQSITAVSGDYLIRTGTGVDCGTGTASLLPSSAVVPRLTYPGSGPTGAPGKLTFTTPIAAPANTAICIICVAVNTCVVQMIGYTAP
jgi:hypothetical protein